MELKAPDDGFIIEQNVALHETIVDNTTNLFQTAKVDPLVVLAAVPEDDLPALHDFKTAMHDRIRWTIRTVGSKPVEGFIDDIGYLIDPNQHTAVVRGHIPNPDGLLRAGQFVTAVVDLLPPKNVVEVPISAIVEDGNESVVFVQADPPETGVHDAPRAGGQPLRADGLRPQRAAGQGREGRRARAIAARQPLREGERVLTAGRTGTQDGLGQQAFGEAAAIRLGQDQTAHFPRCDASNSPEKPRPNPRFPMVRKLIHWSLDNRTGRPPAGGGTGGGRRLFVREHQRGGLPRPGPAHRGGRRADARALRRKKWSGRSPSPWR